MKPYLLGITGGIGSGKSTVSKIFEILGVKIYQSDDIAKYLMENDNKLISSIINYFGEEYDKCDKCDNCKKHNTIPILPNKIYIYTITTNIFL